MQEPKKQRIPGPAGLLLEAQQYGLSLPHSMDANQTSANGTDIRRMVFQDPSFAAPSWSHAVQEHAKGPWPGAAKN